MIKRCKKLIKQGYLYINIGVKELIKQSMCLKNLGVAK